MCYQIPYTFVLVFSWSSFEVLLEFFWDSFENLKRTPKRIWNEYEGNTKEESLIINGLCWKNPTCRLRIPGQQWAKSHLRPGVRSNSESLPGFGGQGINSISILMIYWNLPSSSPHICRVSHSFPAAAGEMGPGKEFNPSSGCWCNAWTDGWRFWNQLFNN